MGISQPALSQVVARTMAQLGTAAGVGGEALALRAGVTPAALIAAIEGARELGYGELHALAAVIGMRAGDVVRLATGEATEIHPAVLPKRA